MSRTESQKLTKAPIKVTLGDKEYEIPILRVRKQWEWRDKLVQDTVGMFGGVGAMVDIEGKGFNNALVTALTKFPRKLAEMLFEYAPDLPKDQILDDASEEQVLLAFTEVMKVAADPMLGPLKLVMDLAKSELALSLSAASTKLQ